MRPPPDARTSHGADRLGGRQLGPDPDGYIQVITGGGGAGLYDFKPVADFGAWSAVHHRRHHYVRFDVAPGILRATTIATDGTGDVLDQWSLAAA